MSVTALVVLIVGICAALALLAVSVRTARRAAAAKSWPQVEATIESAKIADVASGRYKIMLPCFDFTYTVAEHDYPGRFSLTANGERAEDLVKAMPGRKLIIRYDPEKPGSYYLPDERIEGCEVALVHD